MEKAEVRDFLDTAIRNWRTQRDTATDDSHRQAALYYIDCLQNVREALIGTTLGEPSLTEKQRAAIRRLVDTYDESPEFIISNIREEDVNVLRKILLED